MKVVARSFSESLLVYIGVGLVALVAWRFLSAETAPILFWLVAIGLVFWTVTSLAPLSAARFQLEQLLLFLRRVQSGAANPSEHLPEGTFVRELVRRQPDGELSFRSSIFELDTHYMLHQMRPSQRVAIEHAPALFTALGILFTFFGLIYGIAGLQIGDDAKHLAEGMNTLLPSVSVAFESSLLGILLSFVTLVHSRRRLAQVSNECAAVRDLAHELDEKNSAAYTLKKIGVTSDAIEETSAATYNQMIRLVEVSEEQSAKLGSLGSDITAALDGVLQRTVGEPMAQLAQSFENFTAGELDTHNAALEHVLGDFMTKFESTMGDRFEELQTVLDHTLDWHQQSKESLDALVGSLDETAEAWQQESRVQTELVEARMAHRARQDRQARDALEQAEGLTARLSVVHEDMATAAPVWRETSATLGEMTRELRLSVEGLATAQTGIQSVTAELRDGVTASLGAVRDSVAQLEHVLELTPERYQSLADEIRRELDASLTKTFGKFDNATAEVVTRLSGSYLTMQQSLDDFGGALSALDQRLESAGTTQIFRQIKPAE